MNNQKFDKTSTQPQYGSCVKEKDSILCGSSSVSTQFGNFENELLEFKVSKFGNVLHWGEILPSSNYVEINRSYINSNNQIDRYSYKLFKNTFITTMSNKNVNLLVSPAMDLVNIGYTEGEFSMEYVPMKSIIGTIATPIILSEISPSRTEVRLSLLENTKKSVKSQYDAFTLDVVKFEYIANYLQTQINNSNFVNIFYATKEKNPTEFYNFIKKYGFASEIEALFYTKDLFDGVRESQLRSDSTISGKDVLGIRPQFEGYLFSNYEKYGKFSDLKLEYQKIYNSTISMELSELEVSNKFLKETFDSIFLTAIDVVDFQYKESNKIVFKTVLNFGNGNYYPLLNKSTTKSENGDIELILKLAYPLDDSITEKTICCVSNFISDAYMFDVILYSEGIAKKKYLRSANFGVEISGVSNQFKTKKYNYNDIIDSLDETESQLINNLDNIDKIIVDYTKFENFIKFSAVSTRLENYNNKLSLLRQVEGSINSIQTSDTISLDDISKLEIEKSAILNSFDGYERFLYENPNWYLNHTEDISDPTSNRKSLTSASLYDINNNDSLVNNIPEFIREDSANSDYCLFMNMIGHMFDNIWIYIDAIPRSSNFVFENRNDNSNKILTTIAKDFGWELEYGSDSDSISKQFITNTTGSIYNKQDNTTKVWNRIMETLPHIYKTKGTVESVRSLLSCYGIPKNLIQIKEYGGVESNQENSQYNTFSYDDVFHVLQFKGLEFIEIPWRNSPKSLEFKVLFEKNENQKDKVFRLVQCEDRWVIGFIRDKSNIFANGFFSIRDSLGNVQTMFTQKVPIFNGELFDVLLNKLAPSDLIPGTENVNTLPSKFELTVRKVENGTQVFNVSSSLYTSGSYVDMFNSGSLSGSLFFGNYETLNSNLSNNPESFVGCLDQIKIWSNVISSTTFDKHCTFFDGTGIEPDKIEDLLFRLNFNVPQNLYTGSGQYVRIENANTVGWQTPYAYFYNFPQAPTRSFYDATTGEYNSTYYPYQFKRIETVQSISIPNYGSNKYNTNKIRKIEKDLISDLSVSSISTKKLQSFETNDNFNLGIYVSPIEQFNIKLIKSLGDFQIKNYIGNPNDLYESEYKNFNVYKKIHMKDFSVDLDFNTFINLTRGFIDKTLFNQLDRIIPQRANITTGILVEPSIIERTKIEYKRLSIENIDLPVSIKSNILISGSNISEKSSTISINNGKTIFENKTFNSYIFEDSDKYGFGVVGQNSTELENGGYVNIEGKSYYAQILNTTKTIGSLKRDYKNINLIEFPIINTLNFNGYISGYFIGTLTGDCNGQAEIDGLFYGNVTSEYNISGFIPQLKIQGTFRGDFSNIINGEGALTSDESGFSGTFTYESGDIYKYIREFGYGPFLNYLTENEKYEKVSRIDVGIDTKPLIGYWINHRKRLRNSKRLSIQTSDTTIEQSTGLLNGTPAIIKTSVDPGTVRSNGNVLFSN